LSALRSPKRIDAGWRIGSFSAIATGAVHEAAAADHDARTIGPVDFTVPDDVPAHDILRFPRGPSAGDCLHAMFERADFTDPSTWDGAIKRALALHPQRAGDASGAALQRRMLQGLLEAVMACPLQGGVVLGKVPQERRLNELGFHLPARDLSPARLNSWLRSNGYAMPRLSFDALRGYLNGYIDLTFEFAGRYYVLDWKSNHLGYSRDGYSSNAWPARCRSMATTCRLRCIPPPCTGTWPSASPATSTSVISAACSNLFVRGVRPGWVDASGAPLGVWFHRPAAQNLASLDALLAGRPQAKAA
jgi:exodeoxyribonuclease V beta subunit